ncbi:RPA-related protein RADX isoform X2 [Boleophthalmus pectinirostris]|uniref:RPA-related protein RADX isoform X2 n=1 Tax=Boleophthalmus pectinirostris TaxID=150288 RepID=UPI00242C6E2D|nr:RPA-related protein RADX isoform X2 [Boleophthalmus pectinirostris]
MEESSSRPSTASSICRESFLQKILERLCVTQSLKLQAEDTSPVTVVALHRYLSDSGETQAHQQDDSYSYDVTVTDGVWRAKCFLHTTLNRVVHKNSLRTGTDISITKCSFVYNERRLGHGYLCIEGFTCRTDTCTVQANDKDISALPVLVRQGMERSISLQSDVPLQLSRKHYLPLWNNDDPDGEMWASEPHSENTVLDVSKITFLCHLEGQFQNLQKPFPILVKIIHKSRLRYYGKYGLNIDYPYQAYFEVADQSGTMSLVLWNDLCPEFYQRLHVGTVLYLQNYTLKRSYLNRSRPHMDHYRMKAFNSVEICLNPRKPASVITIISPKSVLPQWGLPEVSYQFTTRSELNQLSNNSACDIIGLVTFVGRVERVKCKASKGLPEKYWTYRWIHAVDGTSDLPFIIEIFSSSQPEIFSHIYPMTYLVCTQMRLCHVDGGLPYLTSSCETQMFITGYHKGQPYVSDPKVKSFIQWTKTQKDNVILQKTTLGGYYSYPRAPKIFTQSVEDASGQVPLVAAADLRKELEMLQYREHKRIAIQGQIMAVLFIKHQTSNKSPCLTEEPQGPVVLTQSYEEIQDASTDHDSVSTDATLTQINTRKRRYRVRHGKQSSEDVTPTKSSRHDNIVAEQKENKTDNSPEETENFHSQDSGVTSWESSDWLTQKLSISEHLHRGILYEDSISRRFTFEEKNSLLHWSNLHPARWTPEHSTDPIPPVACPGYYRITILGVNRQLAVDAAYVPVVHPDEPCAVGLLQDPHGNTMLSCLSSGFLCPLSSDTSQSIHPQPEEILETAGELEGLHLVCVLDLCHLGGDRVEVLINKVYKVTEVSLQ